MASHNRDRSDTMSTCEMSDINGHVASSSLPHSFNQSMTDSMPSQVKAGYIAEHTSDLGIYLSSTKSKDNNDNNHLLTPIDGDRSFIGMKKTSSFLFKKTSSLFLHETLVAENATTKRRQRRYMIWNSICFLSLGILLFIFSYNRANQLEIRDIECTDERDKQQKYYIFSIIPTTQLSTYYFFYGSFGLFISIFYVIFFHIALVICCDRFSMALYVLFFTNIITSMVLFYCYIRVRQFFTNLCGYGDLPKNVSLFISIMAIFGIIWTFIPFVTCLLGQCCKCLCPYRLCGYQCRKKCIYGTWSPLRLKHFLCKSIAIISALAFALSSGIAAWYLVENDKQKIWTIAGLSLLGLKLFDIWIVLCLQNGCDIRSVIALLGIYTRPITDFKSMKMSYTQTTERNRLLT